MISKLLYNYAGNLRCKLIKVNGQPYLERYLLGKIKGYTFYLHRFVSADGDRSLHNHPWDFSFSFVLSGWYIEDLLVDVNPNIPITGCDTKERRVKFFNWIRGSKFHQIRFVAPGTWTLFCHSKRVKKKGWGWFRKQDNFTVYEPHTLDESKSRSWEEEFIGKFSGREPFTS